jgi:hypothetical protein
MFTGSILFLYLQLYPLQCTGTINSLTFATGYVFNTPCQIAATNAGGPLSSMSLNLTASGSCTSTTPGNTFTVNLFPTNKCDSPSTGAYNIPATPGALVPFLTPQALLASSMSCATLTCPSFCQVNAKILCLNPGPDDSFVTIYVSLIQFCASSTSCLVCISGYFKNPSGSCQPCSVANCKTCPSMSTCSDCVDGYFVSGVSCSACSSNCQACTSSTSCSFCSGGYFVIGGACQSCGAHCSNCATPTTCAACSLGFFLSNGTCMSCGTGCQACASPTQCTACLPFSGYVLANGACTSCGTGCSACVSSSQCTSCLPGYSLLGGACQQSSQAPVFLICPGNCGGGNCVLGAVLSLYLCYCAQSPISGIYSMTDQISPSFQIGFYNSSTCASSTRVHYFDISSPWGCHPSTTSSGHWGYICTLLVLQGFSHKRCVVMCCLYCTCYYFDVLYY